MTDEKKALSEQGASPRYSWTQPVCAGCWWDQNPAREPVQLKAPEDEMCVFCGHGTDAGIYVRIDPAEASHPTLTKD